MKIHFLGTGASEGIPNPFCKCKVCSNARENGEKEIRQRSSVIIDEKLQIDLSPDFFNQVLNQKIDTEKIENILFTHSHPDHLNAGELLSRMNDFAPNLDHEIHLYGNDIVFRKCFDVIGSIQNERWKLHHLVPFVPSQVGDALVTPLLANHSEKETCLLLCIEKDKKVILYGHDSGWFPSLTREWLADKKIDLVILECTWGFNDNEFSNKHMSIETVLQTKNYLLNESIINQNSKVIISHISHLTELTHDDLLGIFNENDVTVAFDGLIEEI